MMTPLPSGRGIQRSSGGPSPVPPAGVHGGMYFQPNTQQPITTFRTKKDVDQHIDNLIKQGLTEKEKHMRYFSFARSYASVREFGLAKRFLQSYIDANATAPGLAEAYKVMGDILCDNGEPESALEVYKKSHEITPTRIALNRICDLLSNGYGENETPETKNAWFTKQKTAASQAVSDLSRSSQQSPHFSQNQGVSPGHYFHTMSPSLPLYNNIQPDGSQQNRTPQRPGSGRPAGPMGEITSRNFLNQLQQFPQVNGAAAQETDAHLKNLETKFEAFGKQLEKGLERTQQYLEQCITVNQQQLEKGLEKTQQQLELKFQRQTVNDSGHQKLEESLKQIEKKLSEVQNSMNEKMNQVQFSLEKSIDEHFAKIYKDISRKMDNVQQHTDFMFDSMQKSVDKKLQQFIQAEQCKEFKEYADRLLDQVQLKSLPKDEPDLHPTAEQNATEPKVIVSTETKEKVSEQKLKEVAPLLSEPKQTGTSNLFSEPKPLGTSNLFSEPKQQEAPKLFSDLFKKPDDTSSTKPADQKSSTTAPSVPLFSFGGFNSSTDGGGFHALAQKAESAGAGFGFNLSPSKLGAANIFSKPVTPMFSTPTPAVSQTSKTSNPDGDADEVVEEFVPTAEFTPVIPLPPLVEVVRGDENDNTVYEVRAKLLRFHEDEKEGVKEWKERGVGTIKILQDKEQPTKVRIVMWREQIHKLACNHRVSKDTQINPFNNSEKALIWGAMDYADGEPSKQLFVCKFGKPEQCKEFRSHVHRLVDFIKNSPEEQASPMATSKVAEPKEKVSEPKQEVLKPLSELFKKPEGTWTCNGCYLQNKPEEVQCPSCQTWNPSVDPSTIKKEEPISSTTTPFVPQFTFGFKSPADGGGGFQGLAQKAEGTGFGFAFSPSKFGAENIFSKPAAPVFGTPLALAPNGKAADADQDDVVEEFVPTAEFTPVIPLPPLVEVVKGDENENTVYEVRAKLLRLHEDEKEGKKEWKERGVGIIKILQEKNRPSKVRIVMWREQIHKLACNHRITKDTCVNFFNNSDKSLKWDAIDYAEGEKSDEIFVCRFGKAEQCKEFKSHVDRLVELIINSPDEPSPIAASNVPEPKEKVPEPTQETPKPLSELFKKAEGTWTCSACYLQNNPEVIKCPSCETLKPGVDASTIKKEEPISTKAPSVPAFTFGFSSSAGDGGFQALAKNAEGTGFKFGDSGTNIFSKPITPMFGTSTALPEKSKSSDTAHDPDDVVDEFVPTAEFTPVIPLPPLVEVVKGDENEDIVYEVRAKLLRIHEDEKDGKKEWKERGVGNIKILQEKNRPSKARIVMWREQIHKLACNHYIKKDLNMKPFNNSEKALYWMALDFADGEQSAEIFACKFGKVEQCKQFKGHVDRLVALIESMEEGSPVAVSKTSSNEKTEKEIEALTKPLSELFTKPEGSWTCSGCYMQNKPDAIKCPSCETLKPGATVAEIQKSSPPAPVVPQFQFGFKPATTTPPATTPRESPEKEPATEKACTGCAGCDSDDFDFSKLDNRKLPEYPEQTMTPEEFKVHKNKDKLATFDFKLPDFANATEGTGNTVPIAQPGTAAATSKVPVFSGFGGTSSFSAGNVPTFQAPVFGGTGATASPSFSFGSPSSFAKSLVPTPAPFASIVPPQQQPALNLNMKAPTTPPRTAQPQHHEDDYDEEDDDQDYEEYDDEEPIFEGVGELRYRKQEESGMSSYGIGLVCVSYDSDMYCNRFTYLEEQEDAPAIDHIICADTELTPVGDLKFSWSALMESDSRKMERIELEVTFDKVETAANFNDRWQDSMHMAAQANMTEEYLEEEEQGE